MAMNINGLPPGQSGSGTTKARQNDSANKVNNDAPEKVGTDTASKDDTVELSDRAQVLRSVNAKMQHLPDIDQDKVDRIRSAIQNGDYKIDFDKLAAAFRRFESGL